MGSETQEQAKDFDSAAIREKAARIDALMAESGWAQVSTQADGARSSGFLTYTVGLTAMGMPELLLHTETSGVGMKVMPLVVQAVKDRGHLDDRGAVRAAGYLWLASPVVDQRLAFYAARKYTFMRLLWMSPVP